MPAAVVGAGIAAAGSIGGAVIASKGAKSAAKAQQQGNDAAIAAQERAYQQSAAALAPWQQSGLQANSLLMDAYGFNSGQQTPTPQPTVNALYQGPNPDTSGYSGGSISGALGSRFDSPGNTWITRAQGRAPNERNSPFTTPAVPTTPGYGGVAATRPSAQSAFDTFKNSMDYNWQLGQGLDAVNSGYAGAGVLQSGAAMKGINDYAQHFAQGAYQSWLGGVSDLANRGYGAAAAQAGVSTNLGNNTAALQAANGRAQADLQIQKANALGGALNGLGTIGANVLGGIGGYSPAGATSSNIGPFGTIVNTSSGRF